jgi:sugar/nucleoside kinase (ribokinase family)
VACLRGLALEEAIDFSHAVAAMKCLKVGGRSGIPSDWGAIESFRRTTPHRA